MTEQKLTNLEDGIEDFKDTAQHFLDGLKGLLNDTVQIVHNDSDSAKSKTQVDTTINKPTKPAEKKPRVPIIGPILKGVDVPILSLALDSSEYREYSAFRRETADKFEGLVEALNKKYFNLDWQKKYLSADRLDKYKKLSKEFSKNMEKYADMQVEFIFKNTHDKKSLTKRLQRLRDIIVNNYKENSNNQGLIDLPKLEALEKDSKNVNYIMRLVNSGASPDAIATQFESSQFFNKELWVAAVKNITAQLIIDVKANGSEARMIAIVKRLTGSKKEMDFDTAKEKFKDIMEKRAKVGVRQTIALLGAFNKITNAERAEMLEFNGAKPSLRPFIHREREYLLQRKAIPKGIDDRLVVDFMSANIAGRRKMLANDTYRIALFQAIRNIQQHYPAEYRKRAKSLPRKIKDNDYYISKPAAHDRAARVFALLTLAREAEWVIKNLDKTKDYKGAKLVKQFEDTPYEKNIPAPDLKFRDPNKLHKIGYITAASRAGFNGKDLGLAALKGFIGLTIILNLMNARKAEDGWLSGMGQVMTNPFVMGSAGLWYGIDKYKENPEAISYFFQDEGGQRRIRTFAGLTTLSKKEGNVEVLDFINNENEFRAMRHIMKMPASGARKVSKMLKEADKQYAKQAKARGKAKAKANKNISAKDQVIGLVGQGLEFATDPLKSRTAGKRELTKEILAKHFPNEFDQYILSQLPTDKRSNTMRYLFYKKFLTNPKLNVRELQSNCMKWM